MADQAVETAEGDKNQRAFLKLIRWTEFYPHGGLNDTDYCTMYGGDSFTDTKDHPRILNDRWGKKSTAAGAYMITVATWDEFKKKLGLLDFTPASQDKVAIAIIREAKALALVRSGQIGEAMEKLRTRWASLPGASQNQAKVTLEAALTQFQAFKDQDP